MQTPEIVFDEFTKGNEFKSAIGSKGLFEQNKINERFFIGDQWHGAKCGNDRPLVRHNVIKRIGDYKISQILNGTVQVDYSAEGISTEKPAFNDFNDNETSLNFKGEITDKEINLIMRAFSNYYGVTADRVNLNDISQKVLRNAFVCGTSVLYTYWNNDIQTGLYADSEKKININGDICCEILNVEDIVFGDPYCENVQNQPFIIISSRRDVEEVLNEARLNGANSVTLKNIADLQENGKVIVYTKLFKDYKDGRKATVRALKVTENSVVRKEFDTGLKLYPLSVFCWERKLSSAYGESEVTYLIPNQIAINRMITANVWSVMSIGMPIMVVNGDTVTDKITNEPGQLIKVYGSNEDVSGSIKYVSPPNFSAEFDKIINTLIENTLSQNGANEVALGDSRADNATALYTMRDASLTPLKIIKNRYNTFIEDTARIWADFWIAYYGKRSLKQRDKKGYSYIPFDSNRYKSLVFYAKSNVPSLITYNEREKTDMLIKLFEKGVIDKKQLLMRLPDGMINDISTLISDIEKESNV